MQVHQFVDEGLGHSSYVLEFGDGTAALIDPPRFPTEHEALVEALGAQLTFTFDTHSHADYVTGSPAVAERTGATFVAPDASRLQSRHRAVSDGDHVRLAEHVELVVVATPGHTPDHHAYVLVVDGSPVAVFSGGSLMVGTVGRTDLCGPALAVPLAHQMFASLRRLDQLPADVTVYPTHGAGSFCSAPAASPRTSTIQIEREANPLFSISDEDEFVHRLVGGFGTFPAYFGRLPEMNRRGPARYDTLPRLAPLQPADVADHLATGGVVVDARPLGAFAAGHLPGSISIALRPVFASWLGWLVDAGTPLVFVLDRAQDRSDLVRQCLDVGHEHLIGELQGGVEAWTLDGRPVATIALVGPSDLEDDVVDVRQADEFVAGHVPGATNIELGRVAEAPIEGPVVIMCGHGERAMTGASMLAARGHASPRVFDGGPETWAAHTGRSLEVGR